ncbi:TPR REGION domain-containing protein [Citrus sinensis]|uniref:TPR REGION domain-containing protein n=1 Tax=Citrus sinensis TaxID=2711 RepID=A0ACB8LDY8_CITSI|nr:TPR REGION domain-containing protein [Citrus sinensis]
MVEKQLEILRGYELRLLRCTLASPPSDLPIQSQPLNEESQCSLLPLHEHVNSLIDSGHYLQVLYSDAAKLVLDTLDFVDINDSADCADRVYSELLQLVEAFIVNDSENDVGYSAHVSFNCCSFLVHSVPLVDNSPKCRFPLEVSTLEGNELIEWENWAHYQLMSVGSDLLGKFSYLQLHDIDPSEIVSTFHLEAGLKHFQSAEVAAGLQLSVIGVLGFRTVRQVEPKAQMVLVANTSSSNTSDVCPSINQVIHTHDSTVGDASDVFVAPNLLGNSHESESGVQCIHAGWDMAPFIEAIDSQQSSCFILKFFCDLLCIRWESTGSRTKGRALEMMDKLVEGISNSSPGVTQSIPFCYVICVPTIPALRKEYAKLLVSCGLIGEAIKIFEDLELWDNLILQLLLLISVKSIVDGTYCNLGVIVHWIQNDELNCGLLTCDTFSRCSLGDVTNNDACYEKALEVSNDKQLELRSLARSAYDRGEYETSKILWEAAMGLNSLYPDG